MVAVLVAAAMAEIFGAPLGWTLAMSAAASTLAAAAFAKSGAGDGLTASIEEEGNAQITTDAVPAGVASARDRQPYGGRSLRHGRPGPLRGQACAGRAQGAVERRLAHGGRAWAARGAR